MQRRHGNRQPYPRSRWLLLLLRVLGGWGAGGRTQAPTDDYLLGFPSKKEKKKTSQCVSCGHRWCVLSRLFRPGGALLRPTGTYCVLSLLELHCVHFKTKMNGWLAIELKNEKVLYFISFRRMFPGKLCIWLQSERLTHPGMRG